MKNLLLIIGVLTLIIVGVLLFGLSKIGPLIKTAVNKYGPEITKTQVQLGDVDVGLFSAQADIKDFYLGNPEGFTSPDAIKVKSILVDINEKTIAKKTVVIDRIEVVSPQLTYERIAKTDNFQAILNNIRKDRGPSKTGSAEKKERNGKKVIIKDFKLINGKVNLAASLLGESSSFSADLPDIHLTNIGEAKGGIQAKQAIQIILAELQKHIASPDVMNVIDEKLRELKKDLKSLEKDLDKELKEAEGKLKEEAEQAIEKETEDLLKEAEGAFKDLMEK